MIDTLTQELDLRERHGSRQGSGLHNDAGSGLCEVRTKESTSTCNKQHDDDDTCQRETVKHGSLKRSPVSPEGATQASMTVISHCWGISP